MPNDPRPLVLAVLDGDLSALPALVDALKDADDPRWEAVFGVAGHLHARAAEMRDATTDPGPTSEASARRRTVLLAKSKVGVWAHFRAELSRLLWDHVAGVSLADAAQAITDALGLPGLEGERQKIVSGAIAREQEGQGGPGPDDTDLAFPAVLNTALAPQGVIHHRRPRRT